MRNPTVTKTLEDGRVGYWYAPTKTVVVENPSVPDKGTAFHSSWRYFNTSLR
jgi:hypothetical protein